MLTSVLCGLLHLCDLGHSSQRQLCGGQDCPEVVLEFLLEKLEKVWQYCLNTQGQVLTSVDFLGEQLLDFL